MSFLPTSSRLLSAGLLLGFFAGCGEPDNIRSPDNDTDADSDADTDSDVDTDTDSDVDTDTDTDTVIVVDPGDPAPLPPGLSTSQLGRLTDDLDDIIDSAASVLGIHVVDLDNGQIVYTRGADLWLKPASNTKLFTTAVALDHLGRDHRPTVVAYASRAPDGSGRIGSDLVVVGQHDGSWSSWLHSSADDPARRLAVALSRRGVRSVAGRVVLRGDFVHEPYRYGYLDPDAQRSAAATAFMEEIAAAGIRVEGSLATEEGLDAPGGWTALATWRGSSIEASTAIINRISHNELADNLSRHTAWSLEGRNSYAGHEAVVAEWLADAGLDTSGFALNDGSGLSHNNRVSPRLVVGLLRTMHDLPARDAFLRSLSVAGYHGTLAGRMTGADTRGRFLGKTGTLNGVIATSGVLHHAHDGHRYAIGLISNSVPAKTPERLLHDRIITRIAKDLRGGSPRPAPPVAEALTAGSDRLSLSLRADDADGVELWTSTDGRTWSHADATWHTSDRVELPLDGTTYVRLVSVGGGARSDFSDVLVARAESGPRVLLVDGNDRWDSQDAENPLGAGHDFVARVGEALPGYALDSADNDAVLDGVVELDAYDAVIWLLGEESTEDETFDRAEQVIVEDYVAGGGALVVSGSEIAWDLGEKGDSTDRAWLEDVLGGTYVGDDAGTWIVQPGEAAFVDLGDAAFHLPGHLVVGYPDVLRPASHARVALAYGTTDARVAAVRREDAAVTWLGFPVEAIDDVADREAILVGALEVMGVR